MRRSLQRLDLFGPEDGDRYSSDTYSPIIATGLIDGGRVPVRPSVFLSVCQSVVLCQSALSGHDNKTAWQKVTNSSTLCWDFTRWVQTTSFSLSRTTGTLQPKRCVELKHIFYNLWISFTVETNRCKNSGVGPNKAVKVIWSKNVI